MAVAVKWLSAKRVAIDIDSKIEAAQNGLLEVLKRILCLQSFLESALAAAKSG